MSDMLTSALIMVSEFAFVFALGLSVVAYKFFKRRKNDHEQAKSFVEKLRDGEDERNSKRIKIIKEKYNLQDEDIQPYIEKLLEREKSLYGKIIKLFLGKNKGILDQLDGDVEALINACYLSPGVLPATESEVDDEENIEISVDSSEIGNLQKENDELKSEVERLNIVLVDAKKQSEEMMAEYVMMYGKEGDNVRHKVEGERLKVKKEIRAEASADEAKLIYRKKPENNSDTEIETESEKNSADKSTE